ncbi:MAG TPA: response regulator [Steroidobacteraceae bacterium]|jgi:two-component system response regulator|nr:response regulator [Steroidobacteraceae bacterium]
MSRPKLILLVEDSDDDVELALRAFRRAKVTGDIEVVGDGAEAIDYLHASGAHAGRDTDIKPDVVLLDLKLPKIGGIEVLRRVRADERTRRIPIVVLTTSSEKSDLVSCYDLGANGFVRKPVDFGEFVEAAGRIGDYWLATNQPAP